MSINFLYEKAITGDNEAEKQLFKDLFARFHMFVHRKIWNKEDAEDIIQNALMTISREYKNIDIETSFTSWTYKVLDNRILAYYKRKGQQQVRINRFSKTDSNLNYTRYVPDPDLERRILDCLKELSKVNIKYARILNLHYLGYKTEEICKKMNILSANSYMILSRSRSLLKHCLETGRVN